MPKPRFRFKLFACAARAAWAGLCLCLPLAAGQVEGAGMAPGPAAAAAGTPAGGPVAGPGGAELPAADHGPQEANVNQILIAYTGVLGTPATRSRDDARLMALQLARDLEGNPSLFPGYVEKFSDGSKLDGGSVGCFRRGRMTPAFEAAAFALPIGGISARPVETPYGFHILQRVAVPAVYFGRYILIVHDAVTPPAPPHVPRSAAAAQQLAAEIYAELKLHPERFRELQMQHSDDPNKALGGFLPDFYPGRADDTLVQAVAAVKLGETTAPIKTKYGVMLVERLQPLRERPPLKGFASATHLMVAYAGAQDSTANRQWIEARELAQQISAEARKDPAQFPALIRKYSEAPDQPTGGDLGFVDLEHLPPRMYDFGRALQTLPIGAVSEPVESGSGFHVLLRKELPLRLRARQILVAWKGTPAKVVRDKAAAASQAAKYLADLKQVPPADLERAFVAAVGKYSDETTDQGGDLGTFKPQDYFPAVTTALLNTPIGGLSELVETPYGYVLLLRLEPREKLPEELHPVKLPDPDRDGRPPGENPDRNGPLPGSR